jgi:pre-mRNA-splicing factor SYF2
MDEFKEKLKKLKEQRKQASQANFREVLEENERSKRPPNWEKKVEYSMKKLKEQEEKLKAEEAGEDYQMKKNMNYQADEIERWERNRASKRRNQEDIYVDFEEAARRKYEKFTKQFKPDMDEYKAQKEELGEEKFYLQSAEDKRVEQAASSSSSLPPASSLTRNTPEGVERMVSETQKQIEARSKRVRRRRFDDDADVDYINERNMKFNKKLERYYGEFTDEIKKNFERGTAM